VHKSSLRTVAPWRSKYTRISVATFRQPVAESRRRNLAVGFYSYNFFGDHGHFIQRFGKGKAIRRDLNKPVRPRLCLQVLAHIWQVRTKIIRAFPSFWRPEPVFPIRASNEGCPKLRIAPARNPKNPHAINSSTTAAAMAGRRRGSSWAARRAGLGSMICGWHE
jgi:hypothetical protein